MKRVKSAIKQQQQQQTNKQKQARQKIRQAKLQEEKWRRAEGVMYEAGACDNDIMITSSWPIHLTFDFFKRLQLYI